MQLKFICLIFGITPSTASRLILETMELSIHVLKVHKASTIKFPNEEEKSYFAGLIAARESSVRDVIGFCDGLALHIKCGSSSSEQSTCYNGFHGDTTVNSVFVFAPTGKIIHASINFPGVFHDSAVSIQLIQTVIKKA